MPPSHFNRTDAPYQFHAFEVSYFSAKVRPALRYKGLWVDERRADYGEIKKRTGMTFIPMVITPDGETWQDSTEIYRLLEERHPEPPLFPSGPLQRIAGQLVDLYTDEFGLIPAMHYRWGSPLAEEVARARFSAMVGSAELGNRAADRMVAARFLVGAAAEAGNEIEAHTRGLLDALSAHFASYPYLLGSRQSFADCALMGLVDGHLFHDLVSRQLLLQTAMPVVGWIDRCKYPNEDQQGEWIAGDALAASSIGLLTAMGRDAAPIILEIVRSFEDWADNRPDEFGEVPRAVGSCKPSLRGVEIDRAVFGYSLYSVQQVVDQVRELADPDRERVTSALSGTGWGEVLDYRPRHRLRKENFKLVFDG